MTEHKPGDILEVKTKDGSHKGMYIPQEGDALVLKQDSGYNIGILKKNILSVKVVGHKEKKAEHIKPITQNPQLPIISILHTGGTIASKVDYHTGGVIARFSPDELLALFPEILSLAQIRSSLISNMWSDDMRFDHYNIMADAVKKEIEAGAKGVIITHGTDTLHYTSAALSFMFEQLPVPVLLVGAQRSSDRGSSDAALNMLCAVLAITKSDLAGVSVCMHASSDDTLCHILPGTKCRKMHSSRRDAFQPINCRPLATVNYETKEVKLFSSQRKGTACKILPFKTSLKVGLLKIHAHMYASEVLAYKGFDGLLIEGTGLGHAPISVIDDHTKEHAAIKDAIAQIAKSTLVAMSTQTIYGRVDMNVYAPGREMQEFGVLGNLLDMHPETAFIKLAWLLSNFDKKAAAKNYAENLRGELSSQTPVDNATKSF